MLDKQVELALVVFNDSSQNFGLLIAGLRHFDLIDLKFRGRTDFSGSVFDLFVNSLCERRSR
jgi:hypothetical protein